MQITKMPVSRVTNCNKMQSLKCPLVGLQTCNKCKSLSARYSGYKIATNAITEMPVSRVTKLQQMQSFNKGYKKFQHDYDRYRNSPSCLKVEFSSYLKHKKYSQRLVDKTQFYGLACEKRKHKKSPLCRTNEPEKQE